MPSPMWVLALDALSPLGWFNYAHSRYLKRRLRRAALGFSMAAVSNRNDIVSWKNAYALASRDLGLRTLSLLLLSCAFQIFGEQFLCEIGLAETPFERLRILRQIEEALRAESQDLKATRIRFLDGGRRYKEVRFPPGR